MAQTRIQKEQLDDELVVGPASATDAVPALFDGTTGKLLKNSTPTGTGIPVLATSPTLVTPTLGVASATSLTLTNDLAVADGGTGASTAATARVNLGVMNIVVLSSDVVNNDAVANTIADVTGLSFSVTAGETYFFRFTFDYTSAATGTGARFSVNGPAATRLAYLSFPTLTTTSQSINHGLTAYDLPASATATSAATAGNIAIVQGYVTPSANGTVIGRVASEVSSSAITVKAGSILEWYRCL